MSKNFKIKNQTKKTKSSIEFGPKVLISCFLVFALLCTAAISVLGNWVDRQAVETPSATATPDNSPVIVFEDENLAKAIRTSLNLSSSAKITEASAKSATTLSLRAINTISSLKGLEKFVSVESVSFSGIEFKGATGEDGAVGKVDFAVLDDMPALTSISFSDCKLDNVVLDKEIDKITRISVDDTAPTNDFLKKFTDLTSMTYTDGTITDLTVFADLKLTSLSLSSIDTLKDLNGIETLESLTSLSFPNSKIEGLTGIDKAKALVTVSLNNATVTDISAIASANTVTSLSMDHTKVEAGLDKIGEMENLISLNIESVNDGVKVDASFIKKLVKLETLDIDYVLSFDSSNLVNCKELTTLYAKSCSMEDISGLAGLTNLTTLDLTGNQIVDISALAGLTKLKTLTLKNNGILSVEPLKDIYSVVTFDISENPNLETVASLNDWWLVSTFRASGCGLTSIDLSHCTDISILDLSGNKLEKVDFLGTLVSATNINISDNLITELPKMAYMSGLKTFDASNNQIEKVDMLAVETALTTLDLANNKIKDISSWKDKIKSLTSLDLSGNDITEIAFIETNTSLTTLNLADNNISTDVSKLSALTKLISLNLSNNPVTDISSFVTKTTAITTLWLSGTKIEGDDKFAGLLNLKDLSKLYVSNMGLDDLSAFQSLTKLTLLEAAGNNITNFEHIKGMSSLTSLDLSNNKLTKVDVIADLKNLTNLNLSNNEIEDLGNVFESRSLLKTLDLSNNKLTEVTGLVGCTALDKLILKGNQITDYSPLKDIVEDSKIEK